MNEAIGEHRAAGPKNISDLVLPGDVGGMGDETARFAANRQNRSRAAKRGVEEESRNLAPI